jgi:hypothetical protein
VQILGSCHRGNITFTLSWEPAPSTIPARACGCSFCRKHGGVWTSDPGGELRARIRRATEVSNYEFGTRTARFHVCRVCGVVPFVTSEVEGRVYAVVGVNAFTNVDSALLESVDVSFEGEDERERLERRKRNWIGHVEIEIDA